MGSDEETSKKALELIGCMTPRLLSKKSGFRKDDLIRALHLLGRQTGDWRVRTGCERAVQMLRHRLH